MIESVNDDYINLSIDNSKAENKGDDRFYTCHMSYLSSINKDKQRIEKSNKEMVAKFYHKETESLVSKKVIIKLKQELISVLMYLDMKINTCIKFIC